MKPGSRIRSSEITSESNYLNRRQFIRGAGLALGAARRSAREGPA